MKLPYSHFVLVTGLIPGQLSFTTTTIMSLLTDFSHPVFSNILPVAHVNKMFTPTEMCLC
jgi:hypothetical protein